MRGLKQRVSKEAGSMRASIPHRLDHEITRNTGDPGHPQRQCETWDRTLAASPTDRALFLSHWDTIDQVVSLQISPGLEYRFAPT